MKDKIVAFFRWALYAILIAGIGAILARIIYPIAYVLRKPIRKGREIKIVKYLVFPLWIFLNDIEDTDYGEHWWREANGYDFNNKNWWNLFKIAYHWAAIRNPIWNTYSIDPLENRDKRLVVTSTGTLTRNNEEIKDSMVFANLKYVNPLGEYKDNVGEFLSIKFSRLGAKFTWYTIDGNKGIYWRYSYAGTVDNKVLKYIYSIPYNTKAIFIKSRKFGIQKFHTEVHLGSTNNRFTVRFKIKRNLIIFEERDNDDI